MSQARKAQSGAQLIERRHEYETLLGEIRVGRRQGRVIETVHVSQFRYRTSPPIQIVVLEYDDGTMSEQFTMPHDLVDWTLTSHKPAERAARGDGPSGR